MRQIIKKSVFLLLLVAFAGSVAHAVSDYKLLGEKASRFVQFQEWRSALAMYELMLDQRPQEILPYARGIVVSGVLNDTTMQTDLMQRTQKYAIPLDSLFTHVRDYAFSVGQSQQYVDFLTLVKKRQPWIARNIDLQLLSFYTFRNDAPNMIKTGTYLLQSTPDNVEYLNAVAKGYLLEGKYSEAMERYRQIVTFDPENYDALLVLGNYYNGISAKDPSVKVDAIKYLEAAYNLRPTPFVANTIKKLKQRPK